MRGSLLLVAALAAGKKAAQKPSADCIVKAIYPDGHEESRDCYDGGVAKDRQGTKGVFQSCTQ